MANHGPANEKGKRVNPIIERLIPLADAHQAADEYEGGHYHWTGRACSIGCTIRDAKALGILGPDVDPDDHAALAEASAVPEWAWRTCDRIFEEFPQRLRPSWTPRFLRGAALVQNWARVKARFLVSLLEAVRHRNPKAVDPVLALWRRALTGDMPTQEQWRRARAEAWPVAEAAAGAWAAEAWAEEEAERVEDAAVEAVRAGAAAVSWTSIADMLIAAMDGDAANT